MSSPGTPARPDRRRTLQWVLAAMSAGPLASRLALPAGASTGAAHGTLPPLPQGPGYGTDPDILRTWHPGDAWPLLLAGPERAALAAIADLILPADGAAPSASSVGVVDFIDEWISAPYAPQQADRAAVLPGLRALVSAAEARGAAFASLPSAQQLQLLQGSPVFRRLRELVCGGYWSTPEGARDLGFIGEDPAPFYAGPTPAVLRAAGYAPPAYLEGEQGWLPLFDGKSLDGWRASEAPGTFSVADGTIIAHGPRSHLFYVGDVLDARFTDFDFEAEVKTRPHANSGVYFHTQFQQDGWPARGYEVQVNNSHSDPSRTGGLYGIVDNPQVPAADDQWFLLSVRVEGRRIRTWVNGRPLVDYTEPADVVRPPEYAGRLLGSGTFALQGHDPGSETRFRNLRVRALPRTARN